MWTAALGAVAALFRVVGDALRAWQWRQAKRAGRMERELEERREHDKVAKRSGEIDSEIRRLDDAGLTRELRDKWSRD